MAFYSFLLNLCSKIYLLIFLERERKGERNLDERGKHWSAASRSRPYGDRTHNPGVRPDRRLRDGCCKWKPSVSGRLLLANEEVSSAASLLQSQYFLDEYLKMELRLWTSGTAWFSGRDHVHRQGSKTSLGSSTISKSCGQDAVAPLQFSRSERGLQD